jgi:hypothetical protein
VLAPGGVGGQLLGGLSFPVCFEGCDHGRQEHGGSSAGGALGVVFGGRTVEGVEAALDPEVAALEIQVRPLEAEELAAASRRVALLLSASLSSIHQILGRTVGTGQTQTQVAAKVLPRVSRTVQAVFSVHPSATAPGHFLILAPSGLSSCL